MRSRSALVAISVAFALLGLASFASRSLYGVGLSGTVQRVEVRNEKHAPVDDVHLVWIANDTTHVERNLAAQLRAGDELRKGRLDTTLEVNGRELQLELSADFWRGAIALPLMVLLTVLLLRASRRAVR